MACQESVVFMLRCEAKDGGGGGNRTRVRKCVHVGVYMRSLSIGDSPGRNASGALSGVARRH